MKNKKMVATLASLCLIVVAVVAAVVGVLAAVTQNVNSTVTVRYLARNVYAKVTSRALGPVETESDNAVTARNLTLGAAASNIEKQFSPAENSQTKEVSVPAFGYGWSDLLGASNSEFLGWSLYEFRFDNLANAGEKAFSIKVDVSDVNSRLACKVYSYQASGTEDNAQTTPVANDVSGFKTLLTVPAVEDNPSTTEEDESAPAYFSIKWDENGQLENGYRMAYSGASGTLSEISLATVSDVTSGTFSSLTPQHSVYIYVLLILKDTTSTLSSTDSTISFEMTAAA